MKARIHRGAAEIGGTCVELEAEGFHLLVDVGRPLSEDLSEEPRPPAIGGSDAGRDSQLLGVVISHGHPDHYGLAFGLDRRVPIYMGRAASEILDAAAFFMRDSEQLELEGYLEDLTPLELGPFTITPYLVDHSAFDSYALLIEAGGRRLFYTGDLRSHGRKPGTFQRLLKEPPADVNAMLMEGTRLSRTDDSTQPESERDVESALVDVFDRTEGMILACYSPQNIDRYVSMFKAARRSGRELVIDLYAASVAAATGLDSIPQASWQGVRVFVPYSQRLAVKRAKAFERVNALSAERIFPEEVATRAGELAVSFRPSMQRDFTRAGCLTGAAAIWSMWPGYLRDSRNLQLQEFARAYEIPLSVIHCSGHATVADLKQLAEAVSPDQLVPIHTAVPERFPEFFPSVHRHRDGEWWDV